MSETSETKFKTGDPVAYFRHEAEIVIPDLGAAYWTRGARIKYTTGDKAGQLEDVPIADLRQLAEYETAAGKVRAAVSQATADYAAKMAGVRENLIAEAMAAIEMIVTYCGIDLHVMTKEERDSILCGVVIATDIRNDAIVNEAIDRVREKTKKETK